MSYRPPSREPVPPTYDPDQVPATDADLRCLFALIGLRSRQRGVTLADVVSEVGRSQTVVYERLKRLEALGLVAWEANGALRPTLGVVAASPGPTTPRRRARRPARSR